MRRILMTMVAVAMLLTACAGNSTDTTVPAPPNSTKVTESVGNPKIDAILQQWHTAAPAEMKSDAVKPETIEEATYTATGTLTDIQTHYNSLTTKGWTTVKKLTNTQNDQVLLLGYEHGTTSLVVAALDATHFGGTGVVVYTLKGTK